MASIRNKFADENNEDAEGLHHPLAERQFAADLEALK